MIRFAMRARFWAVAGLSVAGAQAGHLLAYQLRFGGAALQVQSAGAHAYFPAFVKTTLGVVALGVIGGLLVITAARAAARGARMRLVAAPSFVGALAALFSVQLALFVAQEIAEALVAGVPPAGAELLLLWGMCGQLPVAVAGAVVLVWLGERVEAAMAILGSIQPAGARLVITAPVALRPIVAGNAVATARAVRSPIVRRGPPTSS